MLLSKATQWCQFYRTVFLLFLWGFFVVQVHPVQARIFYPPELEGDDADDRGDDGDDSASEGNGDSATALQE